MIRDGAYRGSTKGLAQRKLQASIAVLSRRFAADFLKFCTLNSKPLPVVGVGQAGSAMLAGLGEVDIRTDVPLYDMYRFGALVERRSDIVDVWRSDFAAFALGCCFTFEPALREAGVEVRGLKRGRTVPMFRTSIQTVRVGVFGGEIVVSMLPVRRRDVDKVRAITARYPHAHGAPIHVGDPAVLGIRDIGRPNWGEALQVGADEIPVFWASCGTARNALQCAELEMFITETPGRMLVTELDCQSDVGFFKVF
ncbi:D-glutamate cyclase family protein [Nitratireductor soli]|uniref:D-glutamate cyclase family protein n=1 Tax=Nitratireductor soli TaxID=1670619 RepID=UPI001FCD9CBE|nr:DUF1445 domain-containing protein [Nitratireductor soli]